MGNSNECGFHEIKSGKLKSQKRKFCLVLINEELLFDVSPDEEMELVEGKIEKLLGEISSERNSGAMAVYVLTNEQRTKQPSTSRRIRVSQKIVRGDLL